MWLICLSFTVGRRGTCTFLQGEVFTQCVGQGPGGKPMAHSNGATKESSMD